MLTVWSDNPTEKRVKEKRKHGEKKDKIELY